MSANLLQGPNFDEALEVLKPVVDGLPPQLCAIFVWLVVGDPEKRIAERLGISPHTVHANVKVIYRRFSVNSRGELLALVFWQTIKQLKHQADQGS